MNLSVIIPLHNSEFNIGHLINLIAPENYKGNLEVIVVENGSKDNSYQIMKELEAQYMNVKLLISENVSSGAALNVGLDNACGQYIFFCDSDDQPDIKVIFDILQDECDDLISCSYIINNFMTKKEKIVEPTTITNAYWNKLYKRDFLLDNNIRFIENINVQDGCFNSLVTLNRPTIKFVNKVIYMYNVNHGSISDNMNYKTLEGFIINNKLQQLLFKENLREKTEIDIHKYYRLLAYNNISFHELEKVVAMARSEWFLVPYRKKQFQHRKAIAYAIYVTLLNESYADYLVIQNVYLSVLAQCGYANQREYLFDQKRFPKDSELKMLELMISDVENQKVKKILLRIENAVKKLEGGSLI